MTFKILVLSLMIACGSCAYAEQPKIMESDQQVNDFSLAGYGERGRKSWDLSGRSADIFQEIVKLKKVVGNLYGQEENINLTAERGDFNKTDGKVHLEENVVVTTSSGARLTTGYLDWDRKASLVTTDDNVNIERQNMVTVARGIKGEPNLKKLALEKDVRVDISPQEQAKERDREQAKSLALQDKIIITCDGPMDIDYEKNVATFHNNVKVDRTDSVIYCDKMDLFFVTAKGEHKSSEPSANSIDRIVCSGNVKIIRGDNTSFSEQAIYTSSDKKITLIGRPKLIIYSNKDFNDALIGN